jgi:hypothetical protein
MHPRLLLLGLAVLLALGCGGSKKIVPVSGKVTVDGKPMADLTVTFSPEAEPGSIEGGISSTGKTNADGEYTLTTSDGRKGAQVGKHRVSIVLLAADPGDGDHRPRPGSLKNKIPPKYNDQTILKCDVPAGGKNDADFPLTNK